MDDFSYQQDNGIHILRLHKPTQDAVRCLFIQLLLIVAVTRNYRILMDLSDDDSGYTATMRQRANDAFQKMGATGGKTAILVSTPFGRSTMQNLVVRYRTDSAHFMVFQEQEVAVAWLQSPT